MPRDSLLRNNRTRVPVANTPGLLHTEAALAGLCGDVRLLDALDGCCRGTLIQVLDKLVEGVVAALGLAGNLHRVNQRRQQGQMS
jgi:hypothetical protein